MVLIKKILALDPKHDLALLEPEDGWQSKHFHSLDFTKDQNPSSLIRVVGFPNIRFRVFLGRIKDEQPSPPLLKAWMQPQAAKQFLGASGGPVLFENGVLAGIFSHIVPGPHVLFASREKIKKLMSKERLSCTSYTCITEALEDLEFKAKNKGNAETYFAMGYLHSIGIQFPMTGTCQIFGLKKQLS